MRQPLGLPTEVLLDKGYREMYNLEFIPAHTTFAEYERAHPTSAMGPVSDAAAYLFTELDRLNILRSDYLTKDESFFTANKPPPGDPTIKKKFEDALSRGQRLADAALKESPNDPDALLASTMGLGLHANYLAMIEKKLRGALRSEAEHGARAEAAGRASRCL